MKPRRGVAEAKHASSLIVMHFIRPAPVDHAYYLTAGVTEHANTESQHRKN